MPLKLLPRSGSWSENLNYIKSKLFCCLYSLIHSFLLVSWASSLKQYFFPVFGRDEHLIPPFTTSETLPVLLQQPPIDFLRLSSSNYSGHKVLPSFLLQTRRCHLCHPKFSHSCVNTYLKSPFFGYKAVSFHTLCLLLLFVNCGYQGEKGNV